MHAVPWIGENGDTCRLTGHIIKKSLKKLRENWWKIKGNCYHFRIFVVVKFLKMLYNGSRYANINLREN